MLAPLNANVPGFPVNGDRNYGPSGLSVATDRWDVRWAVVLEGRARQVVDDVGYVRLWIDWQTGQPLYYIAERPNHLMLDFGILVHRWSGDLPDYPEWPDRGKVERLRSGRRGLPRRRDRALGLAPRVLRRDLESRRPQTKLRKMATVDELTKGR